MWDMEVDIFTEHDKTLALLADMAPKCARERRRIKTMYECCAMDHIEKAVASPADADTYLRTAAKILMTEADMRKSRAIDAVNTVAALWESIPLLDDADNVNESGGDEQVVSGNDTTTDEEQSAAQQSDNDNDDGGDDEYEGSLFTRLLSGWCSGDYEDDRPRMYACPIGWVMIILSCILGWFMITNMSYGDLLAIPAFMFTFTLLTVKRLYHYSSAVRLSLLYFIFYAAAAGMALYNDVSGICYWNVALAAVVFIILNSGRISSFLDECRRSSVTAYLFITIISAVTTVGMYAVQHALAT